MGTTTTQPTLPLLVRQNLDAFVGALRARFGSRLVSVRLFGSYARGDAHEESDVDCLVLLDEVSSADDRAITDLVGDLSCQIGGVVISPLIMSVAAFDAWKASELARADQSLEAARVLSDAGLLHDAESRLYYGAYRAALALLPTESLGPTPVCCSCSVCTS
jgi:predicted nucleotidyltransferase